jgi:hypothetical protein
LSLTPAALSPATLSLAAPASVAPVASSQAATGTPSLASSSPDVGFAAAPGTPFPDSSSPATPFLTPASLMLVAPASKITQFQVLLNKITIKTTQTCQFCH